MTSAIRFDLYRYFHPSEDVVTLHDSGVGVGLSFDYRRGDGTIERGGYAGNTDRAALAAILFREWRGYRAPRASARRKCA